MKDVEIIVKGEIHTSKGDLKEERELLLEGVDHLILEGAEREPNLGLFDQWYAWILMITDYLFARHLYVDKSILTDLADIQDAEIHSTRESDADVVRNSRTLVRVVAGVSFLFLATVSLGLGVTGHVAAGALLLLISALGPLLLLRMHESGRSETGRDAQMAGLIEDAARETRVGGRVVAVVGSAHAKQIPKFLSDDLPDPKVVPPAYGFISIPHFKELFYPGFVSFSVLYVGYSALLAYVLFIHTHLG